MSKAITSIYLSLYLPLIFSSPIDFFMFWKSGCFTGFNNIYEKEGESKKNESKIDWLEFFLFFSFPSIKILRQILFSIFAMHRIGLTDYDSIIL